MAGLHCYDVYAGAATIERLIAEEPGTYLLTDFLVRSFARTVEQELGLDRWPELRDDYFGHYTRVVWLAQKPDDAELRALAEDCRGTPGSAARRPRRPGDVGLADALAQLVTDSTRAASCSISPGAPDARSRRSG